MSEGHGSVGSLSVAAEALGEWLRVHRCTFGARGCTICTNPVAVMGHLHLTTTTFSFAK